MRRALILWFGFVLATMLGFTVWASLHEAVWVALARFARDPWALATLADAYFAFLMCWFFIAWKERTWVSRLLWLVAVLLLGNLALAAYGLKVLLSLKPGESPDKVLAP